MDVDQWIAQNTFYCPTLVSRITTAQCKINRNNAKTNGTHDKSVHPCVKCDDNNLYEKYQKEMFMKDSAPIDGLENCDVYNPFKNKCFVSIFMNLTACISSNLKRQFQVSYNYVVPGYDKDNHTLKIKLFNEKIPGSQKLFHNRGRFNISGALHYWGLAEELKGKRFRAEYAGNSVVLVHLSNEL